MKNPEPKGLVPLEDVTVRSSSEKPFAFTLHHDAADGGKLKSAKSTKPGGAMQVPLPFIHADRLCASLRVSTSSTRVTGWQAHFLRLRGRFRGRSPKVDASCAERGTGHKVERSSRYFVDLF